MVANEDLDLRRGEILGIAGLVGSGRTSLLRRLYALDVGYRAELYVRGRRVSATPAARIGAGVGFVSEDRKSEGLAWGLSLTDNVTLSRLRPYVRGVWLSRRRRRQATQQWMERLAIKASGPGSAVDLLSGGNQQKVALARILHQQAEVLLLDEPTRGIDVGTKTQIYQLMGELAADGKAIVFVSSYLPELLGVCDRIAVMNRGRLVAIRPSRDWTEESVMTCAIAGETELS
jgi:ribose transport system ATP-binding protein